MKTSIGVPGEQKSEGLNVNILKQNVLYDIRLELDWYRAYGDYQLTHHSNILAERTESNAVTSSAGNVLRMDIRAILSRQMKVTRKNQAENRRKEHLRP